jgi:hypothetical protein
VVAKPQVSVISATPVEARCVRVVSIFIGKPSHRFIAIQAAGFDISTQCLGSALSGHVRRAESEPPPLALEFDVGESIGQLGADDSIEAGREERP